MNRNEFFIYFFFGYIRETIMLGFIYNYENSNFSKEAFCKKCFEQSYSFIANKILVGD